MDLEDWFKLLVPFRTWLERLGLLFAAWVLLTLGALTFYVPYKLGVMAGQESCTTRCMICEPEVGPQTP